MTDEAFVNAAIDETVPAPETNMRIYVYTVPGRKDQPWQRTGGTTLVEGIGLLKVGETTKVDREGADQAATQHRLPPPRRN